MRRAADLDEASGLSLSERESNEEAAEILDAGLAGWGRVVGADSPLLARLLALRGELFLLMGDPLRAADHLERALRLREDAVDAMDAHEAVRARFSLARALWEGGPRGEEALPTARLAEAEAERAGDATLPEIREWLRARDGVR